MAPIARSNLPVFTSSNHTDSTAVRMLVCTFSVCCSMAWRASCAHFDEGTSACAAVAPHVPRPLQHGLDGLRPQLERGPLAHQVVESADALLEASGFHQR